MSEYERFVAELIAAGQTPNDIVAGIEDALDKVPDWALFGDGRWRPDTVCPECGAWCAGICGHRETAGPPILRSEWEAKQAKQP
jgi:hypothetical protein